MTSPSQDGWITEQSSWLTRGGDMRFYKAFDGITNSDNAAHSNDNDYSPWWKLTCPFPCRLKRFEWLWPYKGNGVNRYIEGSNDGINYTELYRFNIAGTEQVPYWVKADIQDRNKYKIFRFRMDNRYLMCNEMILFFRKIVHIKKQKLCRKG